MSYTVSVPATLANLGPGFDVLGMAVDVSNTFCFEARPAGIYEAEGQQVAPEDHLCFATAMAAQQRFGGDLAGLALRQREAIPRGRGMGSSATARIAGLLAYCHFSGVYPSEHAAVSFVSEAEGHPDNAVAAMLGGLTIAGTGKAGLTIVRGCLPVGLRIALCCPEKEVLTDDARRILPSMVPHGDAVYNGSRLGLLLAGLWTNDASAVAAGLSDRLHEPFRSTLIGPVAEAIEAARQHGAVGGCISGSGSTLAAFVMEPSVDVANVAQAMCERFAEIGITAHPRVVSPQLRGAWDDARGSVG